MTESTFIADHETDSRKKQSRRAKVATTPEQLALKALEKLEDPDAEFRKKINLAVKKAIAALNPAQLRQLAAELSALLKKYVNAKNQQTL